VLRRAFELERQAARTGRSRLARRRAQGRLDAPLPPLRGHGEWAGFADKPAYHDAQAVGHRLAELYENEEVDRVVLVYNRFESALVQRVTTTDLLPIREEVLAHRGAGAPWAERRLHLRAEPEQILERLLPVYLETEIYRALLESAAAFLASQMTAMRNASKNAGDLIDSLTLSLNRARQAEITRRSWKWSRAQTPLPVSRRTLRVRLACRGQA
jgi:F-type H+-transporting ATPase subunit gamma